MTHRHHLRFEAPAPRISAAEIMRLVEGTGLTGYWTWDFAENHQTWSEGLYRLCGLPVGSVAASYDRLFRMIHPDDRPATMAPDLLRQAGTLTGESFRILRADSTIRTVVSRGAVTVAADGRPLRASGILVDISDRAAITRALAAQHRQKRAVFEELRAFVSSTAIYPFADFSQEWLDLVGLPRDELVAEPARPIVADERRHWRDHGRALCLSKGLVHMEPKLVLAGGEAVRYRIVMIPLLAPSGAVESWTNYVGPVHLPVQAEGRFKHGLEQRIEGLHLRAARALLDWSMMDLARASGLSFAVVRRLEGSGETAPCPERHRAIEALRQAGIRFSLLEDATIAVGKAR